jgi:hypothetical protein
MNRKHCFRILNNTRGLSVQLRDVQRFSLSLMPLEVASRRQSARLKLRRIGSRSSGYFPSGLYRK